MYSQTSSAGGFQHLTITDRRVRGTKRVPGDTTVQQVDVTVDRPGFFAGASDLVPLAVRGGLKPGVIITAPVWSPAMTKAEGRVFTVVGKYMVYGEVPLPSGQVRRMTEVEISLQSP